MGRLFGYWWRVNDPVTLAVAVPLLFVSVFLTLRGSLRGFMLMLGALQFAFYNYAFYLFGAALDLLLVVTPVAFGAVWLWKRRGWGFIVAVVMNVKGAIYAGMLLTAGLYWGGDDLVGLWAFFMVGSLVSLFVLMRGMRGAAEIPIH